MTHLLFSSSQSGPDSLNSSRSNSLLLVTLRVGVTALLLGCAGAAHALRAPPVAVMGATFDDEGDDEPPPAFDMSLRLRE